MCWSPAAWPSSSGGRGETDCSVLCFSSKTLMSLYERDLEQFALIQMNLARELSRRLRHAGDQQRPDSLLRSAFLTRMAVEISSAK